ncbi:hypothetical protein AZO1586I_760 [Bathymodiolus thermophilus thioautotrophic gill symbiont]|uniref:Uncharacterized protein n=1 Tax=Bathymodiolus thermophilus thioautotrophic gill symbiont TaxID=2360 RepID=A0ABN7G9W4_9GAMM|nr:hypothetical protein [Bathymodiolus thermophilus thioautotrophic gill symbiont]CAC9493536.1 hypothetical protein [uncultured Gammaproteobacteria bacterium]CAB5501161.1 hypothetical protein AZO1586I_760 [Bathymodiolus thermophilus thioautotrophic gill symbiont]CAC9510100.1 hypothetical protein [uncultured Gammaproteobacteria bacterium]CAC9520953.1 hypothetical protein [uncultured Gammaproteobacteria bacterium]CAC9524263.1 hypothetical protein [uncultured Gammaproteobacteria bacterium]
MYWGFLVSVDNLIISAYTTNSIVDNNSGKFYILFSKTDTKVIDFAGINKSEGNVIERRGLASQPRSAVQRNRYPYISTP